MKRPKRACIAACVVIGALATAMVVLVAAALRPGPLPAVAHPREASTRPRDAAPESLLLGDYADTDQRVVSYDWIFTIDRSLDPDCYGGSERDGGTKRQHIVCNGQFPGPEVRVAQGSLVHIRVTNLMVRQDQGHNIRQGMSVHWHGLRMSGKQWHDGVGYVTQCPIGFNQTYTYVIDTTEELPGTHWWHAHMGLDMQDGMFGAFIITPRPGDAYPRELPHYDAELPPMLVHGWWNHSGDTMEWGLSRQYPYWVGNPQSMLVNGKGLAGPGWIGPRGEAGSTYLPAAPCDPTDTRHFTNFRVVSGKSYLLRIIAAGALLPINITIPGHEMTVVQAGGVWLEPVTVRSLLLNLGQRYSVVVRASADPGTNHPIIVSTWGRQAASPECVNEFAPLVDDTSLDWGAGAPTLKDFCTGANVNYRMPAGQAVLAYSGAGRTMDAGYTGVNWFQTQTDAERDASVLLGIRTQTMFRPLRAPLSRRNDPYSGYNPPVAAQPRPRPGGGGGPREPIDLLFDTWWPGELPPETARLVAPGIVSAPEHAQYFRWAVQNTSFSEVGDPTTAASASARVPFLAQSLLQQGGTYLDPSLAFNLVAPNMTSLPKAFGAAAFDVGYGEVVDVILNNQDPTEVHPWHLHGHCFHVLGMGTGRFDPARDGPALNTKDPLCLDTITVMYKSWAYVRFRADNPGLWLLHCHMEAHLVLGMGAMFRVRNAPASDKDAPRLNVRAPPTLTFMASCPVPLDTSWNEKAFSGPSSQYLPFTDDEDDPDAKPWKDPNNYWVPRSEVRAVRTGDAASRAQDADEGQGHGHQHAHGRHDRRRDRPVATLRAQTVHVHGGGREHRRHRRH